MIPLPIFGIFKDVCGFVCRYWKPLVMLLTLLLACSMTYKCTADHYRLKIERKDRIQAQAIAKRSEAYRKLEADAQAFADLVAQQGYDALREKERENESLRAAVAAGRKRLLVNVACPMPATTEDAKAGSMDNGAAAQLHPSAESDYYALRANIIKTEEALKACQRLVTKGP